MCVDDQNDFGAFALLHQGLKPAVVVTPDVRSK